MYQLIPQAFDKWTLKQCYLTLLEKYAIPNAACVDLAICWNPLYVDNQVDVSLQTNATVNLTTVKKIKLDV